MKYVVTIPEIVLLVVTLALFFSIYPITVPWKPVFASPDTAEDYVDIQSDVDSVIDKGTHSNFENQKATDSSYDTLTEANTNTTEVNDTENFVDSDTSDVDGHADHGTSSNFTAQQDKNVLFNDTLTEALTSGGTTSDVFASGFEEGPFDSKWNDNGATTWLQGTNSTPGTPWVTHSGTNMSYALNANDGNLTSDDIDLSGASAAGVSFWYMVDDEENADFNFYFYNGVAYINQTLDLGLAANEDTWYRYTATLNSQYLVSNFRIRFWSGADANEGSFVDDVVINKTLANNYELDMEFQWTTADYDEANEYVCIHTGSTFNAENILVKRRDGTSWMLLVTMTAANTWYNTSLALSSANLTLQFLGGTETSDTSQSTWMIECSLVHVWSVGVNYELELEEQFTDCDYTRTFEELCIYMGAMNGETLSVQWWNSTSNSWLTIIASLSSNQWNNVSVVDYLTSATFTILFVDGTKTNDLSQGTWQKDACLLHTWTLGYNLNLRVMDLDLTDHIQGAYVYKDSDIKTSDADGWANWTEVSGTVQIKVQYFGFWVNETSLTISSDTTMSLQCKLYDVIVNVRENIRNAKLSNVNVTVYNSTNYKIKSGISDNNGQVSLLNLPNNTLTFTCYAKSDYSLVIKNVARNITQDEQIETIICDENYVGTTSNYSILVWVGGLVIPLEGSFVTKRLKRKMYKKRKKPK